MNLLPVWSALAQVFSWIWASDCMKAGKDFAWVAKTSLCCVLANMYRRHNMMRFCFWHGFSWDRTSTWVFSMQPFGSCGIISGVMKNPNCNTSVFRIYCSCLSFKPHLPMVVKLQASVAMCRRLGRVSNPEFLVYKSFAATMSAKMTPPWPSSHGTWSMVSIVAGQLPCIHK